MKFLPRWLCCLVPLLAACDGSPGEPDAALRFALVSLFDVAPPIGFGPSELIAEPGVMCVDTLYAQHLVLERAGRATLTSDRARRCDDGRPRVRAGEVMLGTHRIGGDSIVLQWQVRDPMIGRFEWRAQLDDGEISIPVRVYTEADPEGTSNNFRYIVFRKE